MNERKHRPLNAKQELFCQEYIVDLNGTQAALRAGYSVKASKQQACELLTYPTVQARVQQLQDERAQRTNITADRVLTELAKLAFSDIKNYLNKQNEITNLQDLDSSLTAAISQIETEHRLVGETPVEFVKFKLHDKIRALELCGKHLGLFIDKVQHSGIININVSRRIITGKEPLLQKQAS